MAIKNKKKIEAVQKLLKASKSLPTDNDNVEKALNLLLPYLSNEILVDALPIAAHIDNSYRRDEALTKIIDRLPDDLLPEILAKIANQNDLSHRSGVLKKLIKTGA